jgi:hypothetical protein
MPLSGDDQPAQQRVLKEAERKIWMLSSNLLAPPRNAESGDLPGPFKAGESERLTKLKADMLRVEAGILRKALVDRWAAEKWRKVCPSYLVIIKSAIIGCIGS